MYKSMPIAIIETTKSTEELSLRHLARECLIDNVLVEPHGVGSDGGVDNGGTGFAVLITEVHDGNQALVGHVDERGALITRADGGDVVVGASADQAALLGGVVGQLLALVVGQEGHAGLSEDGGLLVTTVAWLVHVAEADGLEDGVVFEREGLDFEVLDVTAGGALGDRAGEDQEGDVVDTSLDVALGRAKDVVDFDLSVAGVQDVVRAVGDDVLLSPGERERGREKVSKGGSFERNFAVTTRWRQKQWRTYFSMMEAAVTTVRAETKAPVPTNLTCRSPRLPGRSSKIWAI